MTSICSIQSNYSRVYCHWLLMGFNKLGFVCLQQLQLNAISQLGFRLFDEGKNNFSGLWNANKDIFFSTHFLKTVIKDVKNTTATDKQKKAFIFSFSLLQNSTSLKDFEETLKNILNVFFRENIDQIFLNSLEAIRIGCLNINLVKIVNDEEPMNPRNSYKEAENFIFEAGEIFGSLKKNSPFRDYFDRVISETLLNI